MVQLQCWISSFALVLVQRLRFEKGSAKSRLSFPYFSGILTVVLDFSRQRIAGVFGVLFGTISREMIYFENLEMRYEANGEVMPDRCHAAAGKHLLSTCLQEIQEQRRVEELQVRPFESVPRPVVFDFHVSYFVRKTTFGKNVELGLDSNSFQTN